MNGPGLLDRTVSILPGVPVCLKDFDNDTMMMRSSELRAKGVGIASLAYNMDPTSHTLAGRCLQQGEEAASKDDYGPTKYSPAMVRPNVNQFNMPWKTQRLGSGEQLQGVSLAPWILKTEFLENGRSGEALFPSRLISGGFKMGEIPRNFGAPVAHTKFHKDDHSHFLGLRHF